MKIILVFVFLSLTAVTQDKPFWVSASALGAATIADGITTQQMLREGCHEAWSPELYGRYPSNARFYAVSAAIEVTSILLSRKLIHAHSKFFKAAGWSLIAWRTEGRTAAAYHNSQLSCR